MSRWWRWAEERDRDRDRETERDRKRQKDRKTERDRKTQTQHIQHAYTCTTHTHTHTQTQVHSRTCRNGELAATYEGKREKDAIIAFMQDPSAAPAAPEKESSWADEPSDVLHLQGDEFNTRLQGEESALVMFYAPVRLRCSKRNGVSASVWLFVRLSLCPPSSSTSSVASTIHFHPSFSPHSLHSGLFSPLIITTATIPAAPAPAVVWALQGVQGTLYRSRSHSQGRPGR